MGTELRNRPTGRKALILLVVLAVVLVAVAVIGFLGRDRSDDNSVAEDCAVAAQIDKDLEPLRQQIATASDLRNSDNPEDSARRVADGYNAAAKIVHNGADRMSHGRIRDATQALGDQFDAIAETPQLTETNELENRGRNLSQKLDTFHKACG
ncbi:hypothetical protein O3I_008445 [Nocardia brasiliensis ATCC 700358]|uniref:Uncharacterized protein n=1 Tax=Nocardia brasiliensis (strain ATCC 700358 / HUJEG-1) TaxID=1133849 RepID=K0EQ59_NOCB7|nr:hypothetical protein O3I_008445 [Nocardia brasiliensis ATCC 700358]